MNMDMHRFQELCAAYGADPRRWPASEQALFARCAVTAEGRQALAEAARLDAVLDDWRPVSGDFSGSERILASVLAASRPPLRAGWLSTALAACAVLGFVLGYTETPAQQLDSETYASLLLGGNVMEDLQ